MLGGVHAANLRAIFDPFCRVARTRTGDENNFLRHFSVGRAPRFTERWTGGGEKALELQSGQHVLIFSVPVFREEGSFLNIEAGRNDDRADLHVDQFILLVEVDRIRRTFGLAELALAGFEIRTA